MQTFQNANSLGLWRSLLAAALLGVCQAANSPAQVPPAFQPPPAPRTQSSAGRDLFDPAREVTSAATIVAPPVTPPPGITDEKTGATNSADSAKPLEGGEIIARVDGQIVLASDVMWQVNKILKSNIDRIPPAERDRARRMILRQQMMGLIDTKLLYADFRRKVPPENLPTIEKNLAAPFEETEIPRLMKVLDVETQQEFSEELNRLGTSLKDLQRQFNERTIAGEWLRQLAPQPEEVTYDELVDYYKKHAQQGKYDYPAQARWEELVVRFGGQNGNRVAAWKKISEMGNQIWRRVAANPDLRGAVFAELAKAKSDGLTAKNGGIHDWTTKGALRNHKIDEALFSLEVGQLSNIIEFDNAFYIVRVLERKGAGQTPFTEAQTEIRKKLQNQRKQELIQAEIVKLRKQSRVWTVFDGELSGTRLSELLDRSDRR